MTTISVEVSVKYDEPDGIVSSRVVTVTIISAGVKVATGVDVKIIPSQTPRAAGLGMAARRAAERALRYVPESGTWKEVAETMCRELFCSPTTWPPAAGKASE